MSIADYQYDLEACDVPAVRRAQLGEYRRFRRKCLEYMRGDEDTSVMNQVHDLAWKTVIFRTLNEARRIETNRTVNGALWELITDGYVSLVSLGIRKLVDKNPKTHSLCNVINLVEKHPELLTRENFVCYDGLPYNYEKVRRDDLALLNVNNAVRVRWLPSAGPKAWTTSEMLHKAFDKLSNIDASQRKRTDKIKSSIFVAIKSGLLDPAIENVCNLANRRIAHAQRLSDSSDLIPTTTYDDISNALKKIVNVANFLSTSFFYDVAFGSVVPVPQFDVLDALDQPWITSDNMPALQRYWSELSDSIDTWTSSASEDFFPSSS